MNLESKRNQFKRLRYEDNKTWKPTKTIQEVALLTGLSTSAISKIENEGSASCNINTIKSYKNAFPSLSYEYLIDNIEAKDIKNAEIGKRFPYNDTFFQTLENLALEDKNEFNPINLMNILFSDSSSLYSFLRSIFKALRDIDDVKKNKLLPKEYKNLEIKKIEFAISSKFTDLITSDEILQLLQPAFNQYNNYLADMHSSDNDIPYFIEDET